MDLKNKPFLSKKQNVRSSSKRSKRAAHKHGNGLGPIFTDQLSKTTANISNILGSMKNKNPIKGPKNDSGIKLLDFLMASLKNQELCERISQIDKQNMYLSANCKASQRRRKSTKEKPQRKSANISLNNSINMIKSLKMAYYDEQMKSPTHKGHSKALKNQQVENHRKGPSENLNICKIKIKANSDQNLKRSFFENVEVLSSSRAIEEEAEKTIFFHTIQNKEDNYNKNIDICKKIADKSKVDYKSKEKLTSQSQVFRKNNLISKKSQQNFEAQNNCSNVLVKLFQEYLKTVNTTFFQFLENKSVQMDNSTEKKIVKNQTDLKLIGAELLKELWQRQKLQGKTSKKKFGKTIDVSEFQSTFSHGFLSKSIEKGISNGNDDYQRVIDGLSIENTKLESLISQHQRANLKFFIKMNDNSSEEIEQCKKYLSVLFQKYKVLEKMIIKQNRKAEIAKDEKEKFYQQHTKLQIELQVKRSIITELQSEIEQLNLVNQQKSALSKVFDFSLGKSPLRETDFENKSRPKRECLKGSNQRQFVTKRCNQTDISTGIEKQNILNESIYKIRKKQKQQNRSKDQKEKNLPYQVTAIGKQQDLQIIEQLRTSVKDKREKHNLQTVEKLALKKQNEALQKNLEVFEVKIKRTEKLVQDQFSEIKTALKENGKLNRQIEEFERKFALLKEEKIRNNSNKVSLQSESENSSFKDFHRIIALQAAAIEKMIT